MTEQHHVVIFCQGGPQRCRWRKVEASFGPRDEASTEAKNLERAGYKAEVRTAQEHRLLGFPIGWTFDLWKAQFDTHELSKNGWWYQKPKGDDPLGDYHGRNE